MVVEIKNYKQFNAEVTKAKKLAVYAVSSGARLIFKKTG